MQSLASSSLGIESFRIRNDEHDFSYPDGIVRLSVTDMLGYTPAKSKSCQSIKELDLFSIFYTEKKREMAKFYGQYLGRTTPLQILKRFHAFHNNQNSSLCCVNDIVYPSIIIEPTILLKTLLASNKLLDL